MVENAIRLSRPIVAHPSFSTIKSLILIAHDSQSCCNQFPAIWLVDQYDHSPSTMRALTSLTARALTSLTLHHDEFFLPFSHLVLERFNEWWSSHSLGFDDVVIQKNLDVIYWGQDGYSLQQGFNGEFQVYAMFSSKLNHHLLWKYGCARSCEHWTLCPCDLANILSCHFVIAWPCDSEITWPWDHRPYDRVTMWLYDLVTVRSHDLEITWPYGRVTMWLVC